MEIEKGSSCFDIGGLAKGLDLVIVMNIHILKRYSSAFILIPEDAYKSISSMDLNFPFFKRESEMDGLKWVEIDYRTIELRPGSRNELRVAWCDNCELLNVNMN